MMGSSSAYLASAAGSALAQPLTTHFESAFQTDGRTTSGAGGGKQEMAATRPFGGPGSEECGLGEGQSGGEEQRREGSGGVVGEEVAGGVEQGGGGVGSWRPVGTTADRSVAVEGVRHWRPSFELAVAREVRTEAQEGGGRAGSSASSAQASLNALACTNGGAWALVVLSTSLIPVLAVAFSPFLFLHSAGGSH